MISNKLFLLFIASSVLLITIFVENGEAIKCIECSSDYNVNKCNDTIKNKEMTIKEHSTDCGTSTNQCRKLRIKKANGQMDIRRGCYFEGQTDTVGAEVILCKNTDYCNNGNFINFNKIAITCGIFIAIAFKFL